MNVFIPGVPVVHWFRGKGIVVSSRRRLGKNTVAVNFEGRVSLCWSRGLTVEASDPTLGADSVQKGNENE